MFNNKTESTKNIQNLLIKNLTSWTDQNINNEKDAFKHFYNNSEYLLIMFWQSRFDKMNLDTKALNLWITENYLPKEYVFDKNKLNEPQIVDLDIGQKELSQKVLLAVWQDYLNSDLENVVKPPKEKTNFLKRLPFNALI